MDRYKVYFLLLATLAVFSIAGIGVAVAERSFLIAVVCLVGLYAAFAVARKLRGRIES
ncbi:DUF5325 family protein [Bacillus piscicola]|uniref:DUF5325 family protein n=1 Tax=Bacillus piscicola TaxID=1632684 RepID=UPI001F09D892|nr:DUF5325 family protein [Bacillus piscicola]